jgi:hypothetical protein
MFSELANLRRSHDIFLSLQVKSTIIIYILKNIPISVYWYKFTKLSVNVVLFEVFFYLLFEETVWKDDILA